VALEGALSGALAALWLGLLWYAAPLLAGSSDGIVERLRNAVILGVAAPFLLGFLHLLYAPLCLGAALGLCLIRRARAPAAGTASAAPGDGWLVAPLLAAAFAAMPALLQPPLDGDTLIYHLPNAASWAREGSIWVTSTRYWWYPGGSELFACGLLTIGAWWSVGISGTLAAALLGMRIAAWAARFGAPPWTGGLLGAAFVLTPVVAQQSADLQNDVWLAAFFVESLWCLSARQSAAASLALTAMIKPVGWLFAAIAAFSGRARLRDFVAVVPIALWAIRDAALWRSAAVPPASTWYPWAGTSIAAHGLAGFGTLAYALWAAGWPVAVWFALPFAGLCVRAVRVQSLAGVAAAVLFVLEPFGFASERPQLASGASLRFAFPEMAVGALVAGALVARVPVAIGVAAAATTAWGIVSRTALYWMDTASHLGAPLLAACCGLIAAARGRMRPAAWGVVAVAMLATLGYAAASRAVGFYDDALSTSAGQRVALFSWLAAHPPRAVVTDGVRSGAISMLAHGADVFDTGSMDRCAHARALGALLVIGPESAQPPARGLPAGCGRVLYRDAASVVIAP